ncbi:MAG TPA: histidine kinase [Candidatus Methylomirabilis sp.]|nr:histidine kinase [Candidatus Methylomirabilis sp.]
MPNRRWFRWLIALFGWTLVALFFASQTYLNYRSSGGRAPVGIILKMNLLEWYLWGLLAPAIVWLAQRAPLERAHWVRSGWIHLAASVGFALAEWWLNNFLRHHLLGFSQNLRLVYVFHQNFATYWIVAAATHGYFYYKRYREGEVRTAQLSAQLAQAQLQALRMQLHPHFLFNTLNAISTLLHKDADVADRMIARLSDLLRLTLENVGVQEVRLAKELEFLERYLEIERMRFADRLEVRMEIAPETLDARTPYLILQPLVENAIRHGISPRASGGSIEVTAKREDGNLILAVKDDGPGMPAKNTKEGVGISSTRTRLDRLYGQRHGFSLQNGERGGLTVTLSLPFQRMTEETSDTNEARDLK